MRKQTLALLLFVLTLACQSANSQEVISAASLLDEMTSFSSNASWPAPVYTMKQASSYDRKSVDANSRGWFANGDYNQFIRTEQNNGRPENVMMDADGPGAIVRFWLTTVVKAGTLRFYLDNDTKPVVEIPAFDLQKAGFNLGPALLNPHSSYEPNGKGGNTMYFPIPYQKHCKITFEFADTVSAKTSHYYQVNYRTYAAGTRVRTFSKNDLTAFRSNIDRAEKQLWSPVNTREGKHVIDQQTVQAGKQWALPLPGGNNAIRTLAVQVNTTDSNELAKALRSVVLKIDFDDAQTVFCPIGDFSGSGYGGKLIKSWYRDNNGSGGIITRWVMPYQQTAKLTFINTAGFPVELGVDITVGSWNWTNTSLYFHTTYKYEEHIKDAKWDYDVKKVAATDSAAPIEWNFITIKGKGIYLGNSLAVNNHMKSWYGEGDAKVWVDDDRFPSEFGTGLEDYYNTSWAPVVLYQTPFANAPRADNANSYGHNTFTRTRNLDGIPFSKSFRYNLEMLSWDGGTIDAAATIYWYGAKGATDK